MLNCKHGGEASGDKRRCKHQKGVWPQYKNPREISVELQEEIEPDAGWIWPHVESYAWWANGGLSRICNVGKLLTKSYVMWANALIKSYACGQIVEQVLCVVGKWPRCRLGRRTQLQACWVNLCWVSLCWIASTVCLLQLSLTVSAGLLADHASSGVLNCKHGGQMATAAIMQAGRDNGGLQRDVDRRSQSHLVLCIALHRMGPDASRRRGDNGGLERDEEPPGAKPQPDSLHLSPPRAPC